MGSSSGYSVQAQLRYIVNWFNEWSDMQRSDFLPVLAQKFSPSNYVNGLVSGLDSLEFKDRPPSLFQCRVKLFREWSDGWGQAECDQLLKQIKEVDADFMAKFEEELNQFAKEKSGTGQEIKEELVDSALHPSTNDV